MGRETREFMVIQPRAAQLTVVQFETQRPDNVQIGAGIGAQADNVAGVRWDFRLVKNQFKHPL